MKARAFVLTLGCLAAAGFHTQAQAQAQLLPDPAPPQPAQLERSQPAAPDPFAGSHQPYPRVYGGNVAAQPNDHVFTDMRRDPRLVSGVEVAPNVSIEGGYVNLPDKGLHKVEPGKPADASIPLGEKGSSNHLAAKYSLSAGDRLSAYGKAGIAYTEKKRERGVAGSDTGLYTGAGASYKVDKRTTVSGDYVRHGDAAKKFDRVRDGVQGNLKMGF
ncbi:outer membrane beta-barrel protein [Massilia arenae]|nr:outer membrane beta-barrel protein [Massilia arenae]